MGRRKARPLQDQRNLRIQMAQGGGAFSERSCKAMTLGATPSSELSGEDGVSSNERKQPEPGMALLLSKGVYCEF
jgi:hypothetical protein